MRPNKPYFWHRLIHPPHVVLQYDKSRRSVYKEVKAQMLKFEHDKPGKFIVECNDEALKILIWRLKKE